MLRPSSPFSKMNKSVFAVASIHKTCSKPSSSSFSSSRILSRAAARKKSFATAFLVSYEAHRLALDLEQATVRDETHPTRKYLQRYMQQMQMKNKAGLEHVGGGGAGAATTTSRVGQDMSAVNGIGNGQPQGYEDRYGYEQDHPQGKARKKQLPQQQHGYSSNSGLELQQTQLLYSGLQQQSNTQSFLSPQIHPQGLALPSQPPRFHLDSSTDRIFSHTRSPSIIFEDNHGDNHGHSADRTSGDTHSHSHSHSHKNSISINTATNTNSNNNTTIHHDTRIHDNNDISNSNFDTPLQASSLSFPRAFHTNKALPCLTSPQWNSRAFSTRPDDIYDPTARSPTAKCDPFGQGGKPLSSVEAYNLKATLDQHWTLIDSTQTRAQQAFQRQSPSMPQISTHKDQGSIHISSHDDQLHSPAPAPKSPPRALCREFFHRNYLDGASFVSRIAALAHGNGHYPQISLQRTLDTHRKAWAVLTTVVCYTPTLGGLSYQDFQIAWTIDAEIQRQEVAHLLVDSEQALKKWT